MGFAPRFAPKSFAPKDWLRWAPSASQSLAPRLRCRALAVALLGAVLCASAPALGYDGEIDGYVKRVYVKTNVPAQRLEIILVDVAGAELQPCGTVDTTVYGRMPEDTPGVDQVLSVATAAYLSGSLVRMKSDFNSTLGICEIKQLGMISSP